MQGRGTSHRWLIHLIAGVALGAASVLVAWIVSGGQPFGRVIGGDDVSAPTSTVAARTAAERRVASLAARGSRLTARPPELVSAPELEFIKPKREKAASKASRAAKASKSARTQRRAKPRRPARRARRPRSPVLRVVSPPATDDTVAAAPTPSATPVPAPAPAAAPPAPSGAGGGPARPRPAGGTMEG